jgi:hypothetical protein
VAVFSVMRLFEMEAVRTLMIPPTADLPALAVFPTTQPPYIVSVAPRSFSMPPRALPRPGAVAMFPISASSSVLSWQLS